MNEKEKRVDEDAWNLPIEIVGVISTVLRKEGCKDTLQALRRSCRSVDELVCESIHSGELADMSEVRFLPSRSKIQKLTFTGFVDCTRSMYKTSDIHTHYDGDEESDNDDEYADSDDDIEYDSNLTFMLSRPITITHVTHVSLEGKSLVKGNDTLYNLNRCCPKLETLEVDDRCMVKGYTAFDFLSSPRCTIRTLRIECLADWIDLGKLTSLRKLIMRNADFDYNHVGILSTLPFLEDVTAESLIRPIGFKITSRVSERPVGKWKRLQLYFIPHYSCISYVPLSEDRCVECTSHSTDQDCIWDPDNSNDVEWVSFAIESMRIENGVPSFKIPERNPYVIQKLAIAMMPLGEYYIQHVLVKSIVFMAKNAPEFKRILVAQAPTFIPRLKNTVSTADAMKLICVIIEDSDHVDLNIVMDASYDAWSRYNTIETVKMETIKMFTSVLSHKSFGTVSVGEQNIYLRNICDLLLKNYDLNRWNADEFTLLTMVVRLAVDNIRMTLIFNGFVSKLVDAINSYTLPVKYQAMKLMIGLFERNDIIKFGRKFCIRVVEDVATKEDPLEPRYNPCAIEYMWTLMNHDEVRDSHLSWNVLYACCMWLHREIPTNDASHDWINRSPEHRAEFTRELDFATKILTTYFVVDDMPKDEDYHPFVKKAFDKADRSFVPIPATLMSWLRSVVKKYDPSKV